MIPADELLKEALPNDARCHLKLGVVLTIEKDTHEILYLKDIKPNDAQVWL